MSIIIRAVLCASTAWPSTAWQFTRPIASTCEGPFHGRTSTQKAQSLLNYFMHADSGAFKRAYPGMSNAQAEDYPTVSATWVGIHEQQIPCQPSVEQLEHGVWLVRNVLSKAECAAVRQAASQHMQMVKGTLDSQRYRDLRRSIFMCPQAAELVYRRLQTLPLFKDAVEVIHSVP